jgi:hypothetical protein
LDLRTKRHFQGGEPLALSVLVGSADSYTLLVVSGDGLGRVENLRTFEAGAEREARLLERRRHRCTSECFAWAALKAAY